jgi:hypothetical protein
LKASPPVPTLEEFLACCYTACEFLVREYGFLRLSSPREHNPYSVRFQKGDLGVDVFGESYGETVSCDLLKGGARLDLGLLVPAAQRKTPRRNGTRPGQIAQIQEIAARLKLHASDFLSGDTSRFDSAVKEWERITRPRPVTEAQRMERQRQQAVTAAGHASRRADYAEVVRLLEPYAGELSSHQRRMLEVARDKLGSAGG